jgi:hypothetical protein
MGEDVAGAVTTNMREHVELHRVGKTQTVIRVLEERTGDESEACLSVENLKALRDLITSRLTELGR